jgi:hypothetical protein
MEYLRSRSVPVTTSALIALALLIVAGSYAGPAQAAKEPQQAAAAAPAAPAEQEILLTQGLEAVERKTAGCMSCHTSEDSPTMHATGTVHLGCTDCHGGNAEIRVEAGLSQSSAAYNEAKKKAHPQPRYPQNARSSANPVRAYTDWTKEDFAWVKFVNPGDLRVLDQTCGRAGCHITEARKVRTSMMSHGAFLWGAALYNNGAFPFKNSHFGESYAPDGTPQRLISVPPPTPEETRTKGILPFLEPLQRWEISQPGNILRVFERGGSKKAEVGNPLIDEDPGKPDVKLSDRGFGTELRTDPVFLGLQKTRLLDPLLSFPGTNDQPGDFRGSGCTGCHVLYANDRDPVHSGPYASAGNNGFSQTSDPTIPKNEPGHPLKHEFTRGIPSSQCMTCHVHPGTNMVTTYYGTTWWDNEMDGEHMWPKEQKNPTYEERYKIQQRNPEASAQRGLWGDLEFLKKVGTPEFNAQLKHTQFADFHSHGWIFRAVFKHDRKGNLLDENGEMVDFKDPEKFKKAVQLKDIHLEKGMHCVDCHFEQDSHGNGRLYGETRNAVEIDCIDCHGSIEQKANLTTSGPAAPKGGTHLSALRTPWKERRFYWADGKLFQRSMVERDKKWEVVQVLDTITPGNTHYSEKSRLAKTLQSDGQTWGQVPGDPSKLAHSNSKMTCFTCHSSWTPSCFGCHLSMTANQKMPMLHNEGLQTRNWTSYNFQVLRDDLYMLGIDGTVTKHRVAPVRSACAILVSSQNADRDWLYYQQQTISAEGYSGQAFSTYVPHTVRAKETKQCTDCHVSNNNDNNAWMAQLMIQGTNFVNFIGRYAFVATGEKGFDAITVTEHDEPPTVIGSDFQHLAYPEEFKKHEERHLELDESDHHAGSNILDVQARGEYLYAALGKGGIRIYDIANLDNKDFSEKITTAPVSPLGQKFYLKTKDARAIATPTTLGVDPLRVRLPENEEQPIHLIFGFLYVADAEEGLVIVGDPNLKHRSPGVGTLLDGNPRNNFLKRALAFNPEGKLKGARRITIVGTYAYILCDRGLVVVDLNSPLQPKITAEIGAPYLRSPAGVGVQFRYAFVTDADGLKVLDVTNLGQPKPVEGAVVPLPDARNVYVARTYAYVSGGKQGMVIVDVENPEKPRLEQVFDAGGKMNDTNDIKMGAVSSSIFAFVADGRNGLKVVQILSPGDSDYFMGFSPKPTPRLISWFATKGPALAVSKGIDRDRAVDESGNQLAVFGRRGARPFNAEEMRKLYLKNGEVYKVSDQPPGEPHAFHPPTKVAMPATTPSTESSSGSGGRGSRQR